MTCNQTITPSTTTEPSPQPCGAGPFGLRHPQVAFREAIVAGVLSDNPDDERYAGRSAQTTPAP